MRLIKVKGKPKDWHAYYEHKGRDKSNRWIVYFEQKLNQGQIPAQEKKWGVEIEKIKQV